MTVRMLISNIDAAFDAWQSAPWQKDIDFTLFCRYILPYRCSNEHIGGNWRKAMREAYGPLIKGETDMCRAFAIIERNVFKDVVLSNAYCPYTLDAITCHRIGRAECGQRAVLLVDALRALGIPAAIDFVPAWADYSDKSHGWTTAVGKDGVVYTMAAENDTVARNMNPVDASVFEPRYRVTAEDGCPYSVKQTKTVAKVYREEFEEMDSSAAARPGFLSNGFIRDVSERYGLNADVTLDVETDREVFLCTYVSARDWMPVACAMPKNGKVTFRHVGKNAVCTVRTNADGYLTVPFLVGKLGVEKFFQTDKTSTEEIRVDRKYPLCQYTVDAWGDMRGGIFLGADTADFSDADTLAGITTMPHGKTNVECHTSRRYRFFRYQASHTNRSSMSELQFLIRDTDRLKRLEGAYTATGVDTTHLEWLYDDNTATFCRRKTAEYTITLDLGKGRHSRVDVVRYAPSTDLNFVEKGHLYELYYFDTSWHLTGRQIADGDALIFKNVPHGSILLLKDKTAGKEERIFEYANGKQVWY